MIYWPIGKISPDHGACNSAYISGPKKDQQQT